LVSTENATFNDFRSQNYSTSSWQASLVLGRTPFCCYDLLQTWCITRHQLLAAFLRNLCPFLMSNGLQFSNILGKPHVKKHLIYMAL